MTRPSPTDAAIIEPETLSAQARLIMLGTIHRDREGAGHLSRWLDNLRPEVITLEFSPYGMMFRRTHRETLRAKVGALVEEIERRGEPVSRTALEALYDYIEFPYEYRITSQYAEEVGIPFHLLDPGVFSYVKLQKMDELLDPENIRTWFREQESADHGVQKERVLARMFFEEGSKTFSYSDEMLVRDRYIKDRLVLLMRQHQGKRILHVCGWQHLSDPRGVYGPLNPVKVFAYDRTLRV
jgi:hypothetical protein